MKRPISVFIHPINIDPFFGAPSGKCPRDENIFSGAGTPLPFCVPVDIFYTSYLPFAPPHKGRTSIERQKNEIHHRRKMIPLPEFKFPYLLRDFPFGMYKTPAGGKRPDINNECGNP